MSELTPKHLELLDRAKQLLSYKRREVGRQYEQFCRIYLSHLQTHQPPLFHKEIKRC